MSTLGSILDSLVGAGANESGASTPLDDRQAFLDYRMACMESGKTPLAYAEWVKAGRPKG